LRYPERARTGNEKLPGFYHKLLLAASKNTNNCSGFNREAGAAVTTGTQNTAIGASCLGNRGTAAVNPNNCSRFGPVPAATAWVKKLQLQKTQQSAPGNRGNPEQLFRGCPGCAWEITYSGVLFTCGYNI